MEAHTLVMLALGAFVVAGLVGSLIRPGQQAHVIYVMAEPARYEGTGCLPLLLLVGTVLAAALFIG